MKFAMVLGILGVIYSNSAAGAAYFDCSVKESLTLSRDGLLKENPNGLWPQKGAKFIVEYETGNIIGDLIGNKTGDRLLIKGDDSGVFYRSVTTYRLSYRVSALEIQRGMYESETPRSEIPFSYKSTLGAFLSGTCNLIGFRRD